MFTMPPRRRGRSSTSRDNTSSSPSVPESPTSSRSRRVRNVVPMDVDSGEPPSRRARTSEGEDLGIATATTVVPDRGGRSSGSTSNHPHYNPGGHRPFWDRNFWSSSPYSGLTTDNDSIRKPEKKKGLQVKNVDLVVADNRKDHHTDEYEKEGLIVRRGQQFRISVTLETSFNKETDTVKLQFTTGDKPQRSKGTLVRVPQVEELKATEWAAKLAGPGFDGIQPKDDDGTTLSFLVMPAVDCVVGTYTLYVETTQVDSSEEKVRHRHKHEEDLIILFNAWCPEDAVYMQKEDARAEYLLNETGRIFVGNAQTQYGRPWNFGQFEKVCLEAALLLLDLSYLEKQAHGNPALVARAMSAMANNNDNDKGVLVGNWSGKYTGGTSPSHWNGSVVILEHYMITKREVKYGQCWVFSGLITTLCRTLGIPARSVTNFESAHDTDFSMTIDCHVTEEGRPIKHLDDSVWNFHVWNEGWMRRPDLPTGNDGWQAFDSTPQEASEGMMRCGPAPVNAIKEGNVFLGYDTKFLFAEVNGDRITWMVKEEDDDMVAIRSDLQSVGKRISTKAIGSNEREDVTLCYKHPEGSQQERNAVSRASHHSSRKTRLADLYLMGKDVEFKFDGKIAKNGFITFVLAAKNTTDETRTVDFHLYATAKYYTGVSGEELESFAQSVVLEPKKERSGNWEMTPSQYLNRLDEDATVGVYIMARVKETGQIFAQQETLSIDKPDLELELPGGAKVPVKEPFEVLLKFTNPLSIPLTGVVLNLEGPGIQGERKVHLKKTLQPDQEIEERVKLTPKFKGKREVIASLSSHQLNGVTGAVQVEVV